MTTEQYEALFLRMRDKLYRYAYRFVRDEAVAEDVVQDVMFKLWQKKDEADGIENIEAWLMVITRNRSLDVLRQEKDNQVSVEEAFNISDNNPIPDKLMESADILAQLRTCMEQLPEKQKQVFHLREIEQLSYDEISQATGYQLDDVKVSLFRARKHMQRMLLKVNAVGFYQA